MLMVKTAIQPHIGRAEALKFAAARLVRKISWKEMPWQAV